MIDAEHDGSIISSAGEVEDHPRRDLSRRASSHRAHSPSFPASSQSTSSTLRHQISAHQPSSFDPENQHPGSQDHQTLQSHHESQLKRWWFTEIAFPLVAGTFGPLANLFSACALIQPWQVYFDPSTGGSEIENSQRVPDPKWLVGVNASQLLVGLIGNLVLLLNFAQRVRYVIAQVTTISCWYFSSFSLLALVAATETTLRPADTPKRNYGFSQSFYYGIMSLVLYFIISTLLVWNLLGALLFHKYRASFATLTISQRTLMLQTVSYSLYLAMGAGVFGRCEGWGFVNALYWADYTLLTIGLGTDFPLKTTLGRALVIPYAICGILMVGLVVGSVRGLVLERRKAMKEVEKERDEVKQDHRRSGGGEKDGEHSRRGSKEMKKVREKAERRRKWWGFFYSLSAAVIVWAGGAAVFWRTERETQKWTYFEAFYFTYTSLLTIGYGDFYPTSNAGKPFFVIWSLIAVPIVTVLVSSMGDTAVNLFKNGTIWLAQRTILPERRSKNPDRKNQKQAQGEAERTRRERIPIYMKFLPHHHRTLDKKQVSSMK